MNNDDFYDWKDEIRKLYEKFLNIVIHGGYPANTTLAALTCLLLDLLEKCEPCNDKDILIEDIREKLKLLKREYEK
jgi:hypothetical protein